MGVADEHVTSHLDQSARNDIAKVMQVALNIGASPASLFLSAGDHG
jgi:hypothetical protein